VLSKCVPLGGEGLQRLALLLRELVLREALGRRVAASRLLALRLLGSATLSLASLLLALGVDELLDLGVHRDGAEGVKSWSVFQLRHLRGCQFGELGHLEVRVVVGGEGVDTHLFVDY